MEILIIKFSIIHIFSQFPEIFILLMTLTSLMTLSFDLRSPRNHVALNFDIMSEITAVRSVCFPASNRPHVSESTSKKKSNCDVLDLLSDLQI